MEFDGEMVSVIVPTYNRGHLIGETIESVLNQTYPYWELIIVDDGSTDNTSQVVESFREERIRYHTLAHGHGMIDRLRNFGIAKSKGTFIALVDSDDVWFPNKLAVHVQLMKKYPQAMFSFSHAFEFTNTSSFYVKTVFTKRNQTEDDVFVGNIFLQLLQGDYVAYPSLIFKRAAIDTIGWMDETLKSCHGFEYFLRLAATFEGIAINEKLMRIRKHSQSTSLNRPVASYEGTFEIMERYYKNNHIPKALYHQIVSELYYRLGMVYLKHRRAESAAKEFRKYVTMRPGKINGWARWLQATSINLITTRV